MEWKLNDLTKEGLKNIILRMAALLSEEQRQSLQELIEEYKGQKSEEEKLPVQVRMSQTLVEEKMRQIEYWKQQIEEGELYLDTEEYEDYSDNYWDRDWITEYYDNQGIGEKIMYAIRFAKDCVDDGWYQEANSIYEWLWELCVSTDIEYGDPVDLEILEDNKIINTDMRQLALLTLYADYQALEAEKRAEDIYLYFSNYAFRNLSIEEMLYVGRDNLPDTERFWKDWIALLKTKSGDMEGRLLREAILYCEGIEGLVNMADENAETHPSLYLAAMSEYDKDHAYAQIEEIGERALEKIDIKLKIRGETALKAAYASSFLQHEEKMMRFCWECFRSDSTDKNFLRLFGMEKMALQYGMRGKEVLGLRTGNSEQSFGGNAELRQNLIEDYEYYTLCFYTGDFETVKSVSRNPKGSLGWSSSFIRYGIRLFLLYLYEKPLPSKAAASIANYVGFSESDNSGYAMHFENIIMEESHKRKVSIFWNYFQRWKQYFDIEQTEKMKYLAWAEKIVYSRADAIVDKQRRNHYAEVAVLLAMVAEIKENMGEQGFRNKVFAEYKRKFPRHSAFQSEMRNYFGIVH